MGLHSIDSTRRFLDEKIPHHEHIHFAPRKGREGFAGGVHDRFPPQIKGGIEQNWHAGGLAETLDQLIVTWTVLAKDRLQPPRTIDVGYCRQSRSMLLSYRHDVQHV